MIVIVLIIMNANITPSLPVIMFLVLSSYMLLVHVMLLVSAKEPPPYVPRDIIVSSCGGSTATILPYERRWSYINATATMTVSRAASIQSSGDPNFAQLYACIFRQRFSYALPVTPGIKFIRLHFFPTSYDGLKISNALFYVSIDRYTLLNTSLSTSWIGDSGIEYTVKEFCIDVNGPVLNITFTPAQNSPGAYGFVNKIEVVSMPQNLYIRGGVWLPLIGNHSNYLIVANSTALETMYRLNVGGDRIAPEGDTGLYRVWAEDTPNLIFSNEFASAVRSNKRDLTYSSSVPMYTAPLEVYTTARITYSNLSWLFPLDSGFFYLVRLHFCESKRGEVADAKQGDFQIYINNQTAEDCADVFQWSKGAGVAIYQDYIVNFSRTSSHDIQNLSVEILGDVYKGPAMLNGLEIFKLSDNSHNLAGFSPFRIRNLQDEKKSAVGFLNNFAFGVAFGVLALTFICTILIYFDTWCTIPTISLSHLGSQGQRTALMRLGSLGHQCRYFSFPEMKSATSNFSDDNLIGEGGFGKVYKGQVNIDGGITSVAIKRGGPTSHQGLHEFQTEITMLSKLRHCHLVSLIGCCKDNKEMILVYEFMDQGTLRSHLYNTDKPPLPWNHRLKICIDAARGLHYLHLGTKQVVIHRDVKTTNILLDKAWVAKVSDFGLSKFCPNMSHSHVSTAVKGSFGYLDPEYYRRQKLTEKSDVYSFGVVLMEVLCARPAVLPMPMEMDEEEEELIKQVNLAEWTLHCHQTATLDQIIDQYLRGKIVPECFKTFTDIAMKCLAERGSERPRMGDVLWNLELAWKQQEAADHAEEEERKCSDQTNTRVADEVVVTIDSQRAPRVGNSDLTPGAEFSDLIAPRGR